jgi:hypothetical protein
MLEMIFEKASLWHLVFLFIAVSLPGLVSMHVYRLVFAHHDIDWKTAFQESVFWGAINLAIVATPVYAILTCFPDLPTWLQWIVSAIGIPFFVFVIPSLLPLLWSQILKWNIMQFVVNHPSATAWDWFFGVLRRGECYILVHLKNGEKIAGFYGSASYATSFPRNGDLYLEKTVKVDNDGNFQNIVDDTLGLIITRDEYLYVELFEVPKCEQQNCPDGCQGDDNVVQ